MKFGQKIKIMFAPKPGNKKLRISTFVYGALIVVFFLVALMSILAYGTNTQIGKRIAASLSRIIPFPAAIIDYSNVISLGSVEKNLSSVRQFYEKQDFSTTGLRVDFSTPDGVKRLKIKEKEVLNKMIEDKVIEILAKKRGIAINDQEVQKAVTVKLNEYSSKDDVQKSLENLYGWTLDDFKTKVVMPSMYQEALQKAVASEIAPPEKAQAKIQEAKNALDGGSNFADVAKKYSQGSSAQNGGEVGWTSKDQLIPELGDAVFSEAGTAKNKIIESALGFHIVDVEEKKKDGNNDVVRFRQIFVPKETFADWLNAQMDKMHFFVPLSEFAWDKSTETVIFRDGEMKKFEKDALEKKQGDASVMF